MRTRSRLLLILALLAFGAGAASASPIAINFNVVSAIPTAMTGFGTVITDSSSLAPNTLLGGAIDLIGLDDFSMTLVNIPGGGPATTSFTKADLEAWYFSTDGDGNISDLNFFMPATGLSGVNADGYSIVGIDTFHFGLCDGTPDDCFSAESFLDEGLIQINVPAPTPLALMALGAVGIGLARRRARPSPRT